MTTIAEQLVTALADLGVKTVLTGPGDIGSMELAKGAAAPRFVTQRAAAIPFGADLDRAAKLIDAAGRSRCSSASVPARPGTRSWPPPSGSVPRWC
jgi:hypothetical protein